MIGRRWNQGYFDAHVPQETVTDSWKRKLRAFLADVLPDPPATRSGGESSLPIDVSAAGLTAILGPLRFSAEVIELYLYTAGGSNSFSIEVDGHLIYPSQPYPTQVYISVPPFELATGRALFLNAASPSRITGRVRYEFVPPESRRIGGV